MRSWLSFLTRRVLSRLQRYNFALLGTSSVCIFCCNLYDLVEIWENYGVIGNLPFDFGIEKLAQCFDHVGVVGVGEVKLWSLFLTFCCCLYDYFIAQD